MPASYAVVKAWRKKNPEAVRAQKKRHNDRTRLHAENSGKDYTKEEDEQILAKNKPDRFLAEEKGRSVSGIQQRRSEIKKVNPKNMTREVGKKNSGSISKRVKKEEGMACLICGGELHGSLEKSGKKFVCSRCGAQHTKDIQGKLFVTSQPSLKVSS